MNAVNPKKILVVFLSGIGNFLLFTPALRALRFGYPDAEISLCVKQKVVAEIIRGSSFVDNVIHYTDSSFSAGGISFVLEQRRNKYDLVVTTFDAKGWKLALFVKMIAGKHSVGFKADKWYDMFYDRILTDSPGIHEVNKHLHIADSLDIGYTNKEPEMQPGEKARSFAALVVPDLKGPLVGIHPGSSEYLLSKRWMPERFAEVADYVVRAFGAEVIIVGGAAEAELAQKVSDCMKGPKPVILAGRTSIKEAAAVIERCNLFISNDSGLMHVAAAVGTPTVAIFGPTDPHKNAPWGSEHVVVRKGSSCSPCIDYDKVLRCELDCLKGLSAGEVIDIVENRMVSMGMKRNEHARHV